LKIKKTAVAVKATGEYPIFNNRELIDFNFFSSFTQNNKGAASRLRRPKGAMFTIKNPYRLLRLYSLILLIISS
jgi:hypothetical protein